MLVPAVDPTCSEAQSNEIATLDTTAAQVPPNVEGYRFRQSDLSEVQSTTETIKDTQNAGALLIDLIGLEKHYLRQSQPTKHYLSQLYSICQHTKKRKKLR